QQLTPIANEFLTDTEVGRILRVSPWTLRRWRSNRAAGPRYVRIGARVYYPASALGEYLRSLPAGGGIPIASAAGSRAFLTREEQIRIEGALQAECDRPHNRPSAFELIAPGEVR